VRSVEPQRHPAGKEHPQVGEHDDAGKQALAPVVVNEQRKDEKGQIGNDCHDHPQARAPMEVAHRTVCSLKPGPVSPDLHHQATAFEITDVLDDVSPVKHMADDVRVQTETECVGKPELKFSGGHRLPFVVFQQGEEMSSL
jgi:hypothetical protein